MRRFFSYGPINPKRHYHAPRKELIDRTSTRLMGEYPDEDGHYVTIWAPRQCGKTWVMQEVVEKVKKTGNYETGIVSMERAKEEKDEKKVLQILIEKLQIAFGCSLPAIEKINDIPTLFTKQYFSKPVILILDEFDALEEVFINRFAGIFRDISISRGNERNKKSRDKAYLLHGLALVGVRSVLGIENLKGSPFNVQRSVHIPNLTYNEVEYLFKWYEKESGQAVEPAVLEKLYDETRGQPGLTCWFGELLSEGFEGYTTTPDRAIGMRDFEIVYAAATYALPNNNILNIISKAKEKDNRPLILNLFQTGERLEFRFDGEVTNALYMNGVIDKEVEDQVRYYIKFSNPFVQKRLFNYFCDEIFDVMGRLVEPFDTMEDAVTAETLIIPNILKRYQSYLVKNRHWLFKDVPRRKKDLRIYEAVFHFNIYMYLFQLLRGRGAGVHPEFPTGNGKIDLVIDYKNRVYGLELKSYTDSSGYRKALTRAAEYAGQLGLKEIFLVFFIETIDKKNREKYEAGYLDETLKVKVTPIFIETEKE